MTDDAHHLGQEVLPPRAPLFVLFLGLSQHLQEECFCDCHLLTVLMGSIVQ